MLNIEFIKLLKKSWAKRKQFEEICFTARLSNEEREWFDPNYNYNNQIKRSKNKEICMV